MMFKAMRSFAIGIALLSGCNAVNNTVNKGTDNPKPPLNQVAATVIADTRIGCKYLPDVDPVLKLLPTFGGVASDVANAICNAVRATPAAAGAVSTPIIVSGVTVTGQFIQ